MWLKHLFIAQIKSHILLLVSSCLFNSDPNRIEMLFYNSAVF